MRADVDRNYPAAILDLAFPESDASLSLLLLGRLADDLTTEVCEMVGVLANEQRGQDGGEQTGLLGEVATHQLMSALTRRFLVLWELLSARTRRDVPGFVDSVRNLLYALNAQGLVELVGARSFVIQASGEVAEYEVNRSVLAGGHELIKWLAEMGLDVTCGDASAQPRDALGRVQLLCARVADRLVRNAARLTVADPMAFVADDGDLGSQVAFLREVPSAEELIQAAARLFADDGGLEVGLPQGSGSPLVGEVTNPRVLH